MLTHSCSILCAVLALTVVHTVAQSTRPPRSQVIDEVIPFFLHVHCSHRLLVLIFGSVATLMILAYVVYSLRLCNYQYLRSSDLKFTQAQGVSSQEDGTSQSSRIASVAIFAVIGVLLLIAVVTGYVRCAYTIISFYTYSYHTTYVCCWSQ